VLAASIIIALMMKAAGTYQTSVNFYQTTRRNNPEDSHLHLQFYLKMYTVKILRKGIYYSMQSAMCSFINFVVNVSEANTHQRNQGNQNCKECILKICALKFRINIIFIAEYSMN
jgi:hypothetical protein